MQRTTKILIAVLVIFVIGMTLSVACSEPVSAKKFKSSDGYKWKIKNHKWKKMKKQAKKHYKFFRKHGSYHPGYSNGKYVKLTRYGSVYHGTAYAVKNYYGIRCEVRAIHWFILIWASYHRPTNLTTIFLKQFIN